MYMQFPFTIGRERNTGGRERVRTKWERGARWGLSPALSSLQTHYKATCTHSRPNKKRIPTSIEAPAHYAGGTKKSTAPLKHGTSVTLLNNEHVPRTSALAGCTVRNRRTAFVTVRNISITLLQPVQPHQKKNRETH